jgi:hypothetical protein
MNEMTKPHAINQGGSVKKTLFVVALATMLLFAVTGSAFAVVNKSGQTRFGAAGAPAIFPGNNTGALTYKDWSPALYGNALPSGGTTPHGNYTTTTVKCVVCHAVHYAAPGGAPVGSGQAADTLLRMKASDSCVYCHATAGVAVNGRPVYNGQSPGPNAPLVGHVTGTNCSYCHTSVHGVGQDNSVASLAGYLLVKFPQTMNYAQAPVAQPANSPVGTNVMSPTASTQIADMLGAIQTIDNGAVNQGFAAGAALGGTVSAYANTNSATLREQAVGVFCAECHDGAYATAAAGAATNVSSTGTSLYSGHRIAAGATSTWNAPANPVSSSALSNVTVAWAAATNCKSCHDMTDDFGNAAFPHAWGQTNNGAKMWLTSAANVGATKLPLQPVATPYTAGLQLQDGVCLKCHVASGGASGVGITF